MMHMTRARGAWLIAAVLAGCTAGSGRNVEGDVIAAGGRGAGAGAAGAAGVAGAAGSAPTPSGGRAGGAGASGGAAPAGAAGGAGAPAAGGSGGESAGGTSSLTPEVFCSTIIERSCATTERCQPALFRLLFGDEAGCRAVRLELCLAQRSEGNGPMPAATDDCLEAWNSATCEQLEAYQANMPSPLYCPLLHGDREDGAPCGADAHCASGRCLRGSWCGALGCSGGLSVCGVCGAPGGIDADCQSDSDCAIGLRCSRAGLCKQPAAEGDACGVTKPCGPLLGCNIVCRHTASLGEPCDVSNPELTCLPFSRCSAKTATCELAPLADEGEPCGFLSAAGRTACRLGLVCDLPPSQLKGACKQAPGEGEPCEELYGLASVACSDASLRCVKGVCTRPAALDPSMCN